MHAWPVKRYDFPMPIRYSLSAAPADSGGVVICLHGYQDHALSMIRRLGWWENTGLPFQVLAVNGPFPVPIWLADGFKEAYSWYFRDTERDLEFVSPVTTAQRLTQLIADLNLSATPKVIFGFSQGGFLAPYLAAQLGRVAGIIGYGCGYPAEIYAKTHGIKVYAVHGELDERVPPAPARADFDKVLAAGHLGEFHLIPKLTHKVEPRMEPLVRKLALACLK